jgi:hypothetical protein
MQGLEFGSDGFELCVRTFYTWGNAESTEIIFEQRNFLLNNYFLK